MWRMVDLFKIAGIVAVTDDGIYHYGCNDSTEAPPCTVSGLSMHAQALALDIAGMRAVDGTTYSVKTDWMIDQLPSDGNTCTVTPAPDPKNELLHDMLCSMSFEKIFTVFLTPNYNAAHRDHWYVDLSPDSAKFVQ
jgi:hypothetical protein